MPLPSAVLPASTADATDDFTCSSVSPFGAIDAPSTSARECGVQFERSRVGNHQRTHSSGLPEPKAYLKQTANGRLSIPDDVIVIGQQSQTGTNQCGLPLHQFSDSFVVGGSERLPGGGQSSCPPQMFKPAVHSNGAAVGSSEVFLPCKRRSASTGCSEQFGNLYMKDSNRKLLLKCSLPAQIDKPDKSLVSRDLIGDKNGCLLIYDKCSLPPLDIESLEMYQLETQPETTQCGFGSHRPYWLQRFATKEWVLFWMCWFCTVQGMLVNGLVPSVLSTIERRFEFTGMILGRIMQFYDIAYVLCCIPVSYFGGRHSKPLYLGVGLTFLGFGSFLFSVPHFTSEKYEYSAFSAQSIGHCSHPGVASFPPSFAAAALSSPDAGAGPSFDATQCDLENNGTAPATEYKKKVSDRMFFAVVFCVAHFLHGIGSTSLYTLGVSYIDENVKPTLSSMYLGIFYSFAIFGPALGFFLSAGFLRFHTEYFSFQKKLEVMEIDESDPEWIGAWWMGFLISSFLAFVAVVPVLSFPRVLPENFERAHRRQQKRLCRSAVEFHKKRLRHVSAAQLQGRRLPNAETDSIASLPSGVLVLPSHIARQHSELDDANSSFGGDFAENIPMEAQKSLLGSNRTLGGDCRSISCANGPESNASCAAAVFTSLPASPQVAAPLTTDTDSDDNNLPSSLKKTSVCKKNSGRSLDSVSMLAAKRSRHQSNITRNTTLSRRPSLMQKARADVEGIPFALKRLLTNKCYLFINLAGAVAGLLITGFSSFMAKYLERQFSVPSSKANMLIGLIMVPSAGIGTLTSGYIVTRYRLTCMRTLKYAISVCALALVLSPMFLVYCDPIKVAGVSQPYHGESEETSSNASASLSWHASLINYFYPAESPPIYNLTGAKCNAHCRCKEKQFHPVCGRIENQDLTFFSSCYAGCPDDYHPSKKVYDNCTCVGGKSVQRGWCESNCPYLTVFLVLFAPMCLFTFSIGVPALTVILRCVDYHERSFALGIQWILIRCIGTIPAPTLFGWLFDESCIKKDKNPCEAGDESGKCFAWDNKKLSNMWLVFALVGQSITLVFLVLAATFYKKRREDEHEEEDLAKPESVE